jgi:hypothetical protein
MRLRTVAIFGAGYVWGARAGRDAYVDIVDKLGVILDSGVVRDYVDKITAPTEALDDDLDLLGDEDEDEAVEEPIDDEEEPVRSRARVRRRSPARRGR